MNRGALVFLAACFLAFPAAAQTWTGAGADNNWSTGANWSGGVAPASGPTTQLSFTNASPRMSPVVDAPWTVNGIDFGGVGGYTISGQPITLAGAAPTIQSHNGSLFDTIAAPLVLAAPAFVTGSANFIALTGPISGPGSLTITGNGPTILSGTSTFTGGVTVAGGGILGFAGSMPGPVTVTIAGIFSGSGTVLGPVSVNNGGLNLSAPLNTGDLTITGGGFVGESINGTGPGQFGSVSATGTVTLSGATLTLSGSYVPVPGDAFTFIVNDGTDPIVGTFSGLPEGASVTFNGVPLRISYVGGTGNDVTLSAVAAVADTHQVPTLSEWGLIVLASLLLGMGMLKSRRH